ncbi:MAG TPA: thymidine phosphorylase family protein [Caulobacteraceae bacterium]|nr:thymidine phosphorylase family protein [Caulobacteraceae bacterium]
MSLADDMMRETASSHALRAKPLPFDTFRENVVVLARDSVALRPERLVGVRRVELRSPRAHLLASPIICDDPGVVGPEEVGLPQPALRRLAVAAGGWVCIAPAAQPQSLASVRAKIAGETLTAAEYLAIARDLADHRWSDMEVAAFLVACASFMTPEETLDLTRGMIQAGRSLDWPQPNLVDKHCIGGVPGNRTSLIVAPIVAAHGLVIPKTSSRAITSPAGTADTMEVLARVDLNEDEMRQVVERCGGCIIWGGRVNLSPADDVLISVERPLLIDTPEQMVASILSKKAAAGARRLLLDVPVGPTAKVRNRSDALKLKQLFEFVADRLGMTVEVVLTDGGQPIGRGIGPALEARDVRAVLERRPEAPVDLREKAIRLAGLLLETDPQVRGGSGAERARELVDNGAAARKLDDIIAAQGPSPIKPTPGEHTGEITARLDGVVEAIDCLQIARIARLAGAPTDAGAGVDLLCKTGDRVRAGEPLFRLHGSDASDFAFAAEAAAQDSGYRIAI